MLILMKLVIMGFYFHTLHIISTL